jgi:short-subunit dehydrogenase
MVRLEGSTALVTGASRGIGPFLAEALAQRRVDLVLTARDRGQLERVAEGLSRFQIGVHVIEADLSTPAGTEALVREIGEKALAIDILVNNAGMAAMLPYHRIQPSEIGRELYVNLGAPMALCRLLLPGMLERRRGHIVNISSIAGDVPLPYEAIYGATKAGLVLASKALRMEYRGSGVGVSVVLPGVVRGAGMADDFARRTGIGFPWFMGGCSPKAVARAVVRAIERDRAEIMVNTPPMRGTVALFRLWPGLWQWMVHHLPLLERSTRAANMNLEAGGSFTGVSVTVNPDSTPKDSSGGRYRD